MEDQHLDAADDQKLPELSEKRLIDLLEEHDPALRVAVRNLVESLRSDSTLTSGWDSAIGVE